MKLAKGFSMYSAIIVGVALVFYLAMKLLGDTIPQDSPIEEALEEMVEQQVGIDIDLSPDSPE